MLKLAKLTSAIVAIAVISGCSAKSSSPFADKTYLEMTEAEQKVAMEKLVEQSRAIVKKAAGKNVQAQQMLEYHGDSEKDMIYTVAKYPGKIPQKQLGLIKQSFAKSQANLNICAKPEATKLTELGIGFQVRIVDSAGTEIYRSKACKGVKAAKPTVKLRGASSAAR